MANFPEESGFIPQAQASTFVMESHSKTGREFLVFGINCAFLTFSSFPLYGIKNIPLKDICSFFHPSASDILYITIQYLNIFSHHIILLSHQGWELFSLSLKVEIIMP